MKKVTEMISEADALPGRDDIMKIHDKHIVLQTPMHGPFPNNLDSIIFGMGCFWGAERLFWTVDGVYTTVVGYAGGYTPNPGYEEVCSGLTGHTEVILVVYDRQKISLDDLLGIFWQAHDPTQGMRQGNDIGTQYRSAIYVNNNDECNIVTASKSQYEKKLSSHGYPVITTEIKQSQIFYYAEDYHQQYLAKNPNGYCGLSGTGVDF